jgi:hypothetical protein
VIARLEDVDPAVAYAVHEAVHLRDAPGPDVASEMAERLRLPDAAERVPARGFHQVQHPLRDFPVVPDPVPAPDPALNVEPVEAAD